MVELIVAVVVLALTLAFPVAAVVLIMLAWRVHRLATGRHVPTFGRLNGLAHRWHAYNERQRIRMQSLSARSDAPAQSTLAEPRTLSDQYIRKLEARLPDWPDELLDEEDLEQFYNGVRSGVRSLEGYKALLEDQQTIAKQALSKAERAKFPDDDVIEELEDRIGSIDWRLDWVSKRIRSESFAQPEIGGAGKWARFDYVDSNGDSSRREIANWEKRGGYVVGYDRKKKAERTFRQDRISDWTAG